MKQLSGKHARALLWFQEHIGEVYPDTNWYRGSKIGQRLATTANGIYKPQDWEYALSIRISDDGPYRDGNIIYRADASWTFLYRQESQAGRKGEELFTNKALQRCMEDGVPVGIFMKTSRVGKSREYEIGGLGIPTKYENGTFLIEGPYQLEGFADSVLTDFSSDDQKKRVLREIVQRQGQGSFRRRLLEAYSSRCAVTQYDAEAVVEAAHIRPYSGPFSNDVGNGILLRADIHTLFDLRQIAINPDTLLLSLDRKLRTTPYVSLQDRRITIPENPAFQPRGEFLRFAWGEFQEKFK